MQIQRNTTAVLVINTQRVLFEADLLCKDAVIAAINRVTDKARLAGAPVMFIQHDGDGLLAPFTEGRQVLESLHVQEGDLRQF